MVLNRGRLTNYGERQILGIPFGTGFSWSSVYLALGLTAGWTEAGTGGDEPVGNGYARVAIGSWTAPAIESSGGISAYCIKNSADLLFPEPWAPWGSAAPTYAALFDAASAGNCIAYFETTDLGGGGAAMPGKRISIAAQSFGIGLESSALTPFQSDWTSHCVQQTLNAAFRGVAWSPAAHLGLEIEVIWNSIGSYARQSLAGIMSAPATGGDGIGFTWNTSAVTFGPFTGPFGNSGQNLTIWDAASGGNSLFIIQSDTYGATPPDALRVPTNALVVKVQ